MATRQTSRKTAAKPAARAAASRPAARPAGTGKRAAGATRVVPDTRARRWSRTARAVWDSRALRWLPAALAVVARSARRWWRAALDWSGGGVPFASLVVSVLGLADSVYLTIEHFSQSASFACPENSTINCIKVTTSAWSYLPAGPVSWSVPVSVAGLAFFVFMLAINSPWGWRAPWPAVHWARLISVSVGMVLVLYLIWAELFRINAICLYCTGVHALTFILFALIVSKAAFSGVRGIPATR
jgi:uncharacterized membrane protein